MRSDRIYIFDEKINALFRASILNGCRENRTASGKNFSRSRGSIWRTDEGVNLCRILQFNALLLFIFSPFSLIKTQKMPRKSDSFRANDVSCRRSYSNSSMMQFLFADAGLSSFTPPTEDCSMDSSGTPRDIR